MFNNGLAFRNNNPWRGYLSCVVLIKNNQIGQHRYIPVEEIYPECVVASWDALILLLDAENIERRVQLDAEKKSNVYANYKLQEDSVTRYANLCFVETIFIN